MLNIKWYPSQAPAAPTPKIPKSWGVSYFKHIKTAPTHGGRIIARVVGTSKDEVEQVVKHICDLHNSTFSKTAPGTDTGK